MKIWMKLLEVQNRKKEESKTILSRFRDWIEGRPIK